MILSESKLEVKVNLVCWGNKGVDGRDRNEKKADPMLPQNKCPPKRIENIPKIRICDE